MTEPTVPPPLPAPDENGSLPSSEHLAALGPLGRLRAYFFAGVLITAPISITFYLAWQFIGFVDQQVAPLIPEAYNPQRLGVPGVGLLLVIFTLTFIGMFAAGLVGRTMVKASEQILARMPVIRGVYGAVKQIFQTVLAQKSQAFREVVLLEYPRRGLWTIGFITGVTRGEVKDMLDDDMVNVFVPTTPNPTSGFLLFLPRRDVRVLDMTVEEGLKLVISTGIITPEPRPKLAPPQEQPEFSQSAAS